MLATIPSSFTTHGGWLSENALISNQWTDGGSGDGLEPFIQFSSPQSSQHVKLEACSPPSAGDGGHRGGGCTGNVNHDLTAIAKKLKHNASERDRRRKINSLYYSLRCLLPATNPMKRMSNPSTISKALKYIPELQQQVEGLRRRKQGLVTKVNSTTLEEKQKRKNNKVPWMSSLCALNLLSETEALLQIASKETLKQLPFSQILLSLEEDGLLLLTASSFQSFDGRFFFTLLLQVNANTSSRVLQEILNKELKREK
ncbi:transcription factor bHLH101-like [Benincasa hispida]|uniref:transcription factor bHLH101-like n=1 Tax=Benincasa hispida TaxID=102211 RepID=UPI00190027A7|nr:transcription factor bHLH101-like [Benincasa hispida]